MADAEVTTSSNNISTQTSSQNSNNDNIFCRCIREKYGYLIVGGIISVMIIVLSVVLSGKKKVESNPDPFPIPIPYIKFNEIIYHEDEINIYEETISKKSSIIIYNSSEINQEKPIDYIGEYIFNIYNIDNSTGSEIYSAFVVLQTCIFWDHIL